jgi:dCMP deaminase
MEHIFPITIALIGELSSGKETIAKYLNEKYNFEMLNTGSKVDYSNKGSDIKINTDNLTEDSNDLTNTISTTTLSLEESKISEEISLKEKLRKLNSKLLVIYPHINYEEYMTLSNKSTFRLVNIITPTKIRHTNYINKYKDSDFENFITEDFKISTDVNFNKLRSKAFINISNDSTLEALYLKVDKIMSIITTRFRPKWEDYFMSVAHILANRSNCVKQKVGAVLVKDKRILATGYNGTPSKIKNCYDGGCDRCNDNVKQGVGLDQCFCLHAEENAVLEVGRHRCKDAILFTSVYPCLLCAKIIIEAGITKVYYDKEYNSNGSKIIFENAEIELIKWRRDYEKFI